MKRQRGQKRYYRNLARHNDLDKIKSLDFNNAKTWFDNWHLHFDWKGLGNNSFRKRKPHLDKLFRHFNLLADKTKELKLDFQLYVILLDFSSNYDALFLHTSNINNSQFPFQIENLSTKSNLNNQLLDKYIKDLQGYELLFGEGDENFCLLYKKNIGQSFF